MSVADFGPKMRALATERQQRFVLALLDIGARKYTAAYKLAGYKGNANSLNASAWKLAHRQDIQEALHEEASKRMHGLVPLALKTMGDIMEDENATAGERGRIALGVADRAGLHASVEHRVTVGLADDTAALARIKMLAERNGIPLESLLGGRLTKQAVLLPEPAEPSEESAEDEDDIEEMEAEFEECDM